MIANTRLITTKQLMTEALSVKLSYTNLVPTDITYVTEMPVRQESRINKRTH